MDTIGNDLSHEIKFENWEKQKLLFDWVKHFFPFLNESKYFLILGKVVFIIPHNSIALALFLSSYILKS